MSSQMDDDPVVPQPVDRPNDYPEALLSEIRTHRRTGVIVGIGHMHTSSAKDVEKVLMRKFPDVTIAVVTQASGLVAFEWDADE